MRTHQHADTIIQLALPSASQVHSGPDWIAILSNIAAVILGALIAGLSSYIAAQRTVDQSQRLSDQQRTDQDVISALRLTTKVMLLTNSLAGYDGQLRQMMRSGAIEWGVGQPWRYILPIAGGESGRVAFSADDLIILAKAEEHDLLSGLIMLATQSDILVEVMGIYRSRRDSLLAVLPVQGMRGSRGWTDFSTEQLRTYGPQMVDCNGLIGGMLDLSAELIRDARALVSQLNPALRRHLPDQSIKLMGLSLEVEALETPTAPSFLPLPFHRAVAVLTKELL